MKGLFRIISTEAEVLFEHSDKSLAATDALSAFDCCLRDLWCSHRERDYTSQEFCDCLGSLRYVYIDFVSSVAGLHSDLFALACERLDNTLTALAVDNQNIMTSGSHRPHRVKCVEFDDKPDIRARVSDDRSTKRYTASDNFVPNAIYIR